MCQQPAPGCLVCGFWARWACFLAENLIFSWMRVVNFPPTTFSKGGGGCYSVNIFINKSDCLSGQVSRICIVAPCALLAQSSWLIAQTIAYLFRAKSLINTNSFFTNNQTSYGFGKAVFKTQWFSDSPWRKDQLRRKKKQTTFASRAKQHASISMRKRETPGCFSAADVWHWL